MNNDRFVVKHNGLIQLTNLDNKTLSSINVCRGGRNLHIVKDLIYGPAICNSYIVEYCKKGGIIISTENEHHEISAGDLYVIYPNKIHTKHYISDSTATTFIVADGTVVKKHFKQLGFTPKSIVFPYKIPQKGVQQLESLVDSLKMSSLLTVNSPKDKIEPRLIENSNYSNNFGAEAALREFSLFTGFLAELYNVCKAGEEVSATLPIHYKYIDSALQYIEANYPYDITVDSIAKHVGITRNYLFMIFRDYLSTSPQKVLLQTRMRAACEFLQQTDASIKDVAISTGYDPLAFSRAFKNFNGITPSEYRRTNGKET